MSAQNFPVDFSAINIDFIKSLPLIKFKDIKSFPEVPCVYFVSYNKPEHKIIYIGMSENLYNRFNCHTLHGEFSFLDLMEFDVDVAVLETPGISRDDIELLEMLFIKKIDPILNNKHRKYGNYRIRLINQAEAISDDLKLQALELVDRPLTDMSRLALSKIAKVLSLDITRLAERKLMVEVIERAFGDLYDAGNYISLTDNIIYLNVDRKDNLSNIFNKKYVNVDLSFESLIGLSIRALKKMARDFKIYRYSYMTKDELVKHIIKVKNEYESIINA